jgi:uncharacterized membrane protein
MNSSVMALLHFVHILVAVLWIGGIIMILFVILPGSKESLESTSLVGKLMQAISNRFTPIANLSIFLLIVTGFIIFYTDKNYTSFLDINNIWNIFITSKYVVVAIMVIIHFYRGLVLNKKIKIFSSKNDEVKTTRLKKLSLDLVKTNFVLGIIVLLLSAASISV